MKALLVDDERLARAELKRLLKVFPEIEIAGEATNVEEAVAEVGRLDPDLVFLDIEMPGGTGFDVLERLERTPLVVFTTAYDTHAIRAFEVSALDYLLKPVDPKRLRAVIGKAEERLAATNRSLGQPPPGGWLERSFVRDGELCLVVEFCDVVLFESEGNYTRLHLASRSSPQPLLARSLSYLEERLDPKRFFRANRKALVTLARIARFEPSGPGFVVHLENGSEVEMSRRQAQRFRQLMSA